RQIVEEEIATPVLSLDEERSRFEARPVSDFWANGVKECWEVRTRSGRRIETTPNHKYLTPDGWKLLNEIRIGDFVAVPKTISVFGTRVLPEAEIKFAAYMLAEGCCVNHYGRGKHGRRTRSGHYTNFTNTDPILIKDFE